jgi:K+/H+ antiporter YhaU regulatory subunit KhtT
MARMALQPRLVDVLEVPTLGRSSLELQEVLVEEGSPLLGRTVAAAGGTAPVLAVRRADGAVVASPSPDLVLAAGDLLLQLAEGTGERTTA